MATIREEAPAKLNLTLDVLGKREDGYHEMKMVMQSVSLADEVTITTEPGEGIRLTSNLGFLPADRKNLAVAAAIRFQEVTGTALGQLTIRLEKRIPVCAGTAGGSSDAAAVLRGLNRLFQTGLSLEELARMGEAVGSDVPYCVWGKTALAEGRGEKLTLLPALPPCWLVLAKPGFPISTPELFARLDRQRIRCRPDTAGVMEALEKGDLGGVARRLFNVFEEVLPERKRNRVEELKGILLHHGALGVCMSGTGPTVFGIFRDKDTAESAEKALKEHCNDIFLCRSL